ncbi:phosphoketolase [Pluteus cervinus]|uniref:Phosphoketolase n=1 Tax=Pluteus cervinus TaxID=181527 RepID=A0ACD3BBC0_9AGAR|nr:phosphoketolase [Pluteus cervinus]
MSPQLESPIPNPPPAPSELPDSVLDLAVKLDFKDFLSKSDLESLRAYGRAANYIAAAMIFLKGNVLLEEPLTPEHIKPRLLGHWGTCPGLILAYSNISRIIAKTGEDVLFVTGPGHGAPGILACLWLENSLGPFLPQYTRDRVGMKNLITGFSTPGGLPSHLNAQTPGAIHEGGELGYALSVSFGAIMDNPNLIAACVVGDGEAETGPTAAAWHSYKYIDPAESGAVLPILHVNGFKISERTIYGMMDDKEIVSLFSGYGYQVRIVKDLENIENDLAASLTWAISEIRRIQHAARSGQPIMKPRWPLVVLRTPKGWGGPKKVHGTIIEGSYHSHQVPLPNAKTDDVELRALATWLESYKMPDLLREGEPINEILNVVPTAHDKRMGQRKEAYRVYLPLHLSHWEDESVSQGTLQSCMKIAGKFLAKVIEQNPTSFRIFSPDELVSNKLDAVFKVTNRNCQWDPCLRGHGGRVIEILSEHTLQGMLQGYTLTGRTGLFPSYEAFLGIIHTMMVQYSKFCKMASETSWRQPFGSLNYVETSTWTRQEHNGFSHQNPSFIGSVLNLKPQFARVYLPPDANCFLSTLSHCLRAKNYVNLIVGSKQPTPVWLSPDEADKHCIAGASIWSWASVDSGEDPDVVLVGIGVETTFEVVAAAALLRKHVPQMRVRVVNVTDLMILSATGAHPHALSDEAFEGLFTNNRVVHFNYHSYPIELRGLLGGRRGTDPERIWIAGYSEEGTTTTPFDMMLCNHTSRYDIACSAIRGAARSNPHVMKDAHVKESLMKHMARKERDEIYATGRDRDDVFDVPVFA